MTLPGPLTTGAEDSRTNWRGAPGAPPKEIALSSACEADVGGTLSMHALALASETPSALLDWNNNYGSDRAKCVATHCSNFPKSFVGGDIEISELDILGESLGRDRCFAGRLGVHHSVVRHVPRKSSPNPKRAAEDATM